MGIILRSAIIWIGVGLALAAPALGAEYHASNAAELSKVCERLLPGDTVILRNGAWESQRLEFRGNGTAEEPITFCAETNGEVVLTGQSSALIDGEHLIVRGIWIRDADAAKDGILMRGQKCRLTECAVTDSAFKFYLRMWGADHAVDRCYFAGKQTEGPTLQVEVGPQPNRHRIEKNHFGPRPPLGGNGGETIRIGYSHQSMNESRTLVAGNLFERCDGEIEVISNKACGNIYQANTFFECAGMLTLRHGNRCRVEGNFFLGGGKHGSGGVRVIGEGHVVINNYVEKVARGGFWITAGIPDSRLNGYFEARDCVVAFNTVVHSQAPCVEAAAGLGTSGRTILPVGITMANNVFVLAPDGEVVNGAAKDGYRWIGNVIVGNTTEERAGLRAVTVQLAEERGIFRAAAGGVLPVAEGDFPEVATDIDGQPRVPPVQAGCDQASDAPVVQRPLTMGEVGPPWRRESLGVSDGR